MVTVCPSQFATRRLLFHVLVGCVLLILKVSRLKLPVIFFFQAEDGIRYRTVTRVQTCALPILRVPTPQDEDRRRICRERKTLTAERIRHVNRIKGLLFSQGIGDYEPLRRDRRRALEAVRTGDGRTLGANMKAQIGRELDRVELLLDQIAAVEAERDAMLAREAEA